MTPETIETCKTELSCKLAKLASRYSTDLLLGNEECEIKNLENLVMATNLFEVLCLIKFFSTEEDEVITYELACSTEEDVEKLLKTLKKYLNEHCGCN